MFEVSLLHAAFVAAVGLYPEEKVLYNDMEVDISLAAEADLASLPFIDYAVVYQNVKETEGQNKGRFRKHDRQRRLEGSKKRRVFPRPRFANEVNDRDKIQSTERRVDVHFNTFRLVAPPSLQTPS